MDINKCNKPIHFTCPKCKTDFEFSGGQIVRRKAQLQSDIKILKAKMQTHRNEYGKDGYYHKLLKQLKEKEAQYSEIKSAYRLANEQGEIQLFTMFKKECKKRFGEDVIQKILEDCEEEMSYNTYDMAIQNHNTFTGA